ncbi:hypothetical protein M2375_003325 [Comamonas sp. BIGb0152]|nr:hypothetical protein [Comamonas sp. BIGb0152]
MREHGYAIGDLRSRHVCEGREYRHAVAPPQAFDIAMVHDRPQAWGDGEGQPWG